MKRTNLYLVILFCGYIGGFFILNLISPQQDFSPLENRNLAKKPKFTFESLFSGEYTKDFETYITDQFVFRDSFVEMKSSTERLFGKMENNGVYIGDNNILIDKFDTPDIKNIDRNISYINNFTAPSNVYVALYPTQNDIYSNRLPKNAPFHSQKEIIDYAYAQFENPINVYDTLLEKNDEYLYYYTDHHWTSLGAYYAYVEIATAMGKTPIALPEKITVADDFNGTIFSKSGVRYAPSDLIDIYTENYDIEIEDGNGVRLGKLYDESFLDTNDKYGMFLGGNHPIVRIKGKGEGNLLILKDSYSNALVPFLLENYESIHMIDMRFMKLPISEYAYTHHIEDILISYAITNFESDKNLSFLK